MCTRFTLAYATLVLAGCGSDLLESGSRSVHPIQTDRARYEATPYSLGEYAGVEAVIPMRFTNITTDTVYFIGCRQPPAPQLQKREKGEWIRAWSALERDCLSPPWVIAPGATFDDTLRVYGFWPGQNMGPEFWVDLPGRYRLVRPVHADPDPLAPLIEEEARVSNEFELVWASQ